MDKRVRISYEEWEYLNRLEREYKKARIKYFLVQKLIGFLSLVVGIATPLIFGDATISLILIPIGTWLILTRKEVITL